jgi:hypothetical protein
VKRAPRSNRNQRRAAAAALLTAGLLGVAALRLAPAEPGAPVVDSHVPAAAVPRASPERFHVPDASHIASFDLAAGRLYLLDAMNHRVLILEPVAGGWAVADAFGRRGGGPGELSAPLSLAVSPDGATVAILDDGHVRYFTGTGVHLRSHPLQASCVLPVPAIHAGRNGFFVTGTCYRGTPPDTFIGTLHHAAEGGTFALIAEDVRMTRDGRIGSYLHDVVFGSGEERHIFGTGASACVHTVTERPAERPVAEHRCDLVGSLFSAPAPPGAEERLRQQRARRPEFAATFAWPRQLPAYHAYLSTAAGDVMLRQYSADSLVLRVPGSEADLMVASLNGLVGCRREGCLWSSARATGVELGLLSRDSVAALIRRRESEP